MYDGVIQGSGSFTRSLGSSANQLNIIRSGGFAARGGPLTVTIGGDVAPTSVGWSTQGSFVAEGESLQLGS